MPIFKSHAELLSRDGEHLSEGAIYLHLPRGLDREQRAGGTMSLQSWADSEEPPVALRLEDGRLLDIEVSRDALSSCSQNRVLRFETQWPPQA